MVNVSLPLMAATFSLGQAVGSGGVDLQRPAGAAAGNRVDAAGAGDGAQAAAPSRRPGRDPPGVSSEVVLPRQRVSPRPGLGRPLPDPAPGLDALPRAAPERRPRARTAGTSVGAHALPASADAVERPETRRRGTPPDLRQTARNRRYGRRHISHASSTGRGQTLQCFRYYGGTRQP
jgi:hypothetical protein